MKPYYKPNPSAMKRFTKIAQWLFVLALGSGMAFAQSNTEFDPNASANTVAAENVAVTSINESFENAVFPPTGWSVQNPLGGTGWSRQTAGTTPVPGFNGGVIATPAGGGNAIAFCNYSSGGAGSVNSQWLITPPITISTGYSLTFKVFHFGSYVDSLGIMVSTTGSAPANFTVTLAEIGYATTDTGWYDYTYDLSAFNGQDIYIGFHNHIGNNLVDGASIWLDMVEVDYSSGPQPWTLQYNHDVGTITGSTGIAGAGWDGTHLYAVEWTGTRLMYKFSVAGVLMDSINPTWITGASGLRDLAWDGTYLYGSDNSTTIYQFSPTGTLITTITSPIAVRSIAYDEINDAFWVNNWGSGTPADITLISRTGAVLNVITTPPSNYGMAYDNNSAGGPYLWLFTGTSSASYTCQVEQFKISTAAATGVIHSVSGDVAPGIAGGLFAAPNIIAGQYTLGGGMQGETSDRLFGYYLDMVVSRPEVEVSELAINVFPNPASEQINVTSDERIVRMEIMNSIGQMVYSSEVNGYNTFVNVSTFEKGVYFMRVEGESSTVTRKITVK